MEQESLLVTSVPRTLDTKNKILGLELGDVLLLLLNLSIQNLFFGTTSLKIPMVFGTNIILAAVLFLFKRGKPDQYLQHFSEFVFSPSIKSANHSDRKYQPFPRRPL